MQLLIDRIASPIGAIDIVAAEGKLIGLEFVDARDRMAADLAFRFGTYALKRARNPFDIGGRLRAYFAGDIAAIDEIETDAGGTPFQRRVWAALRRIPAGSTVTYGDLARAAGRSQAIRAAGTANGRNPISIVVPCHRVIGRDGTLTGYGGGLDRKAWLLRHEGVSLPA
jgi:O-6-methylguanine DNA methyltransferase